HIVDLDLSKLSIVLQRLVRSYTKDLQGSLVSEGYSFALTAFADADHAGCQDTRRSTSGSIQLLGDRLVSWSSKRQKRAAISST
ncbi:uncharacterized mitochondrial protein-like protein, partial [Tanacetum coccineum]